MRYFLIFTGLFCSIVLRGAEAVVSLDADRQNARYQCGETAVFSVHVPGVSQVTYSLKYARRTPEMVKSGTLTLQDGKGKITGTLAEPGMLYCMITVDNGTNIAAGVAFEPEKIVCRTEEAKDFDAFWAEGKRLQAQCPPIVLEKLEQYSSPEVNSYLMKIPCVDGKIIYGYLSEPAAEGSYPAVINLPGAGPGFFEPDTEWAKEGVISLRVNVHPYFPGKTAEEAKENYRKYWGTETNYIRQNSHDPRLHVYFRAHLAIDRAVDFAASRSNYDGKHFVSYGSSQGGTLGLALAALNPHLTALAAMVPGFGDHAGFLIGRSNSHLLILNRDDPALLASGMRTAGYFDSAFFARRIRVPVLMTVGFIDPTCTPASVWAIYNAISAPKQMIEDVKGVHAISKSVRQKVMDFVRREVRR